MAEDDYSTNYDEASFWDKLASYGKTIGSELTHKALSMYYAMQDSDTPAWAKTVIVASLGYFIFPADAIPDMIPGVGFADDAGAIATAFGTILMHIKKEHQEKARAKLDSWFRK